MNLSRSLSLAVAVLTLVGSGTMCHALARNSEELQEAASRVAQTPMAIGDWQGQDVAENAEDELAFAQAGAQSHLVRTYVDRRTKVSILVILMCGRPGKMAVHTPEVCYRGAGFEFSGEPAVCSVKNEPGAASLRLWTGLFTKKNGTTTNLRLYWAWSAHGDWEASTNPRWQFLRAPFLYKLYISRDLGSQPHVAPLADPAEDFLRQLLPALNKTLFPPPPGERGALAP
jgi:hypothetical protein